VGLTKRVTPLPTKSVAPLPTKTAGPPPTKTAGASFPLLLARAHTREPLIGLETLSPA
jgi:hypothetical protein